MYDTYHTYRRYRHYDTVIADHDSEYHESLQYITSKQGEDYETQEGRSRDSCDL
jgi:hypothetical protein